MRTVAVMWLEAMHARPVTGGFGGGGGGESDRGEAAESF